MPPASPYPGYLPEHVGKNVRMDLTKINKKIKKRISQNILVKIGLSAL